MQPDKPSLSAIRKRSALAWEAAIESAQRSCDTVLETKVRAAYKRAMAEYDRASRHLSELHGAITNAQQLAMDYGDDGFEREFQDALPFN